VGHVYFVFYFSWWRKKSFIIKLVLTFQQPSHPLLKGRVFCIIFSKADMWVSGRWARWLSSVPKNDLLWNVGCVHLNLIHRPWEVQSSGWKVQSNMVGRAWQSRADPVMAVRKQRESTAFF
jgi:hypothetical protein